MHAASLPRTTVFRAGIAVITGDFIDDAITVVVDPVAIVGGRLARIAFGKSVGAANPRALAGPNLIVYRTGRRKP